MVEFSSYMSSILVAFNIMLVHDYMPLFNYFFSHLFVPSSVILIIAMNKLVPAGAFIVLFITVVF